MRFPSFVHKGDTIGFVAPSFGCAGEPYYSAFQNSLKKWKELGFKTELGDNCYASEGVGISNTPEKCATEFMRFYEKNTNQVLISCGGGELMCEILDFIDFDALKNMPSKWFMGYSDNTNLTFLLTTLTDTAAVYGPNAGAFGMEPWHMSIQDTFELLQGEKLVMQNYPLWEKESLKNEENPLVSYHVTEPFVLHKNGPKDSQVFMKGRLLGGCLDCLSHLRGTKFDKVKEFNRKYEKDGIIWFLESCDLNVFEMRRALWSLKQAGWFDTCKGFLIGRPGVCGQVIAGLDQYEAVVSILNEFDVPILMDLDIGHVAPMMPLICGSVATVTAAGNDCQVDMRLI